MVVVKRWQQRRKNPFLLRFLHLPVWLRSRLAGIVDPLPANRLLYMFPTKAALEHVPKPQQQKGAAAPSQSLGENERGRDHFRHKDVGR